MILKEQSIRLIKISICIGTNNFDKIPTELRQQDKSEGTGPLMGLKSFLRIMHYRGEDLKSDD